MPEVKLILKADNSQHIKAMKEAQTATQKVYDTSEKGGKREKGILEEIDATLVKLNKQKQKAFSYEEIEKYNRKIAETKKYLEEYEKAGLKAEKSTEKSTNGMIKAFGKLFTVIGGGHAVLEGFKKVIEATDITFQKFEEVVAGAEAGVSFFFKTLSSGDWTNFMDGLKKATNAGIEFRKFLDNEEDKRNEFLIVSAEREAKIAELRDKTNDKSSANNKERKAALEEMIKLEEENFKEKEKLATDLFNATLKNTAAQNKLTEDEIKMFLREYSSIEELITLGEKYNAGLFKRKEYWRDATEEELKVNPRFKQYLRAPTPEEVKEAMNEANEAMKAGVIAAKFGKLTDKEKQTLSQLWAEIENTMKEFGQATRRNKSQLAGVTNDIIKEAKDARDKEVADTKKANQDLIDDRVRLENFANDWFEDEKKRAEEADKLKQNQWDKEVKTAEMTKERLKNEAKIIWDYWSDFNDELAKINEEAQKKNFDLMVNSTFALLSFANEMSARNVEQSQTKRELLDQNVADAEAALQEEIKIGGKSIAAKKKELETLKTAQRDALISEQNARSQSKQLAIASMLAEKAIAVAEVVIQTQVANAKAVALFPLTAGLPFTAINNAMMIKSIIAIGIAAALDTIATSTAKFAKGGWTGNGRGRDETGERVAGVVHEKEFVVRRGPASKFIDVLEAINRDDKRMILSSFNKLSPELLGGTMVNNIVVDNQGSNNRLDKLIEENKKLNNRLINSEIIQEFGTMTVVKKGSTIRTIRR